MRRCFTLALSLWLFALPACADGVRLLQSFVWSQDARGPKIGGLSGLEVTDGGTGFITLSDRGTLIIGDIIRSKGRIAELSVRSQSRLKGVDGKRLTQRSFLDSEGIALDAQDRIYMSFEWKHRVWRYATATSKAEWLPVAPAFRQMQSNSSLEALAISDSGAVYTLPERSGAIDRPFPVYRYAHGTWTQPFEISRTGQYMPTGADFGPDGRLYLLERGFVGIGFSSRIRAFTLNAGGTKILSESLLLTTPVGTHDNMEGLSVWEDDQGRIRLTMISDDNFRFFQKTEMAEYVLTK